MTPDIACEAVDCVHNENGQCIATDIFVDDSAFCTSYITGKD